MKINEDVLSEVYYTIKYSEDDVKTKIPQFIMDEIRNNMNIYYDVNKQAILDGKISEDAKAFISVIYTEYLCTTEEKKNWNELDKKFKDIVKESLDRKKEEQNNQEEVVVAEKKSEKT